MTTCLMTDERADPGPPPAGYNHHGGSHAFDCETADLDYFLRRPRMAAIEHWGVEGQGLFGALRLQFSIGAATEFAARHGGTTSCCAEGAALFR